MKANGSVLWFSGISEAIEIRLNAHMASNAD
jgi:hypothetical protein